MAAAVQPRAGVGVTVAELMRLRAEAARLRLPKAATAEGEAPDLYDSLHRGRGLEFEEVRGYQPGDDVRTIDWRVTARTGRLHTKVFREERERAMFVAVDAGATMRFGTRVAFKWVAAARAAALLAWLAVEDGDRVGGLVFGDGPRLRDRPPAAGVSGLAPLFKLMAATPDLPPGETPSPLAPALARLRHLARRGAVIGVFGDFAGWDDAAEAALTALAAKNDVTLVMVRDPLEAELPQRGRYVFAGDGGAVAVDAADARLRAAHAAAFEARRIAVEAACRRVGARLCSISTDQPTGVALREGLLRRPRHG